MKKNQFAMQSWWDKLDRQWKQLPTEQKRRMVRYSFAGYLILTVAIVGQVFYEVGRGNKTISVEHITNPVAKVNAMGSRKTIDQ